MRKQFFKLFLLILGLSLGVLFIQGTALVYANHRATTIWPRFVISEYLNSVVDHVYEQNYSSTQRLMAALLEKVPDTISGLLIRDKDENYTFMYGSSTRGKDQDRKSLRFVNSEDGSEFSLLFTLAQNNMLVDDNTFEKKVSVFTLNVTTEDGSVKVDYTDRGNETVKFTTPGFLNKDDVAGKVYINNNGTITGSFDVIIYDMNNFGPTWMLLQQILRSFLISLPIGLLVAVLASYTISKNTTNDIAIIKECLSYLGEGKYDFKVPKLKNDEYDKIASSIEALRGAMEQTEKSRHEWLLSISHDLNTPVTSLLLLYEGLKDHIFTLDDAMLDSIYKELNSLKNRISSVSYYTNLRLIGDFDSLSQVNLASFVHDTITNYPTLDVEIESSLDYSIKCDSSHLTRALNEAFKNCSEYSTDKKVYINAFLDCDKVHLIIKNRGHICPSCDYFELWTRGDASRANGGSGLGLPIIKRIMELNGGALSFTQEAEFVVLEFIFSNS